MGFTKWLKQKNREIRNVDYSIKLSENFLISEFEKSQTAIRHGISNRMGPVELQRARLLAAHVLQPVRDQFGPTTINSGFRSEALNDKIGGSDKSQHSLGEAADIEVPGTSNYDLAVWIRDNLEFDQLILEGYHPGDPSSGWVHVSFRDGANRKEVLTAEFIDSKAYYSFGLVK